jgi:glyoxylase-like metal-dependent hydrolase (beta-lactamase superfamily II)
MNIIIEAIKVGPLEVICYVIGCPATHQGMLIDPAAPSEVVGQQMARHNLSIRWIVNTHGHADHTAGNEFWSQQTGAPTVVHERDWQFFSTPEMQRAAQAEGFPPLRQIDRQVRDGDRLPVGQLEFTILHTAGHTPGSICLYVPGHLFTGDTLFVDDAGRTDLPGGSLEKLVSSIQQKILPLPDDTIIWPGHDYGDTPTSTLAEQKINNPYITDFLE